MEDSCYPADIIYVHVYEQVYLLYFIVNKG